MCNGTITHWRCKCTPHSCPRWSRDHNPGHPWDTRDYGAYFFCNAYLLSDRFDVGHLGIPRCPQGVTTGSETRYRAFLCPDCVAAGCPPIDHSVRFEDSAQNITSEQMKEIAKRGRSTSRSKTAPRASSTDTIRPKRPQSRSPTPVPAAGVLGQEVRAALYQAQYGLLSSFRQLQNSPQDPLPDESADGSASRPVPQYPRSDGKDDTQSAAYRVSQRGLRGRMPIPQAVLRDHRLNGPVEPFNLQGNHTHPCITTADLRASIDQLTEWLASEPSTESQLPPLLVAATGVWDAERIWRESQISSPVQHRLGGPDNPLNRYSFLPKSISCKAFLRAREDGGSEIDGHDGKTNVVGAHDPENDVDGSEADLYDVGGPDPELFDVGGPDPEVHPELLEVDGSKAQSRLVGGHGLRFKEVGEPGAEASMNGVSDDGVYALDRYDSEDV